MKQFLRNIKPLHVFILALTLRLILIPLAFHSDLNTNTIWGIYAKEFGLRGYYDWLNFGNYARPEYPPFSTLLFLAVRWFWQGIFSILWFININIPLFPSKLVTWFDNFGNPALLKLPGIFADLGIGYLILRYTKSLKLSVFYLFNPAVIYLSAVWGQTESFVSFFALLGIILFLKKKYFSGFWSFFISFLTKASLLPSFPIVLFLTLKNKIKIKEVLLLVLSLSVGAFIVGSIFTDHAPIEWLVRSYQTKFVIGPQNLPFINLNAFNFWGLILGFSRISDKPYLAVAWIISSLFFIFVSYKYYKGKNIFFALVLMFFASFMFLPRMHERYLFPVFVFFPFILHKFPKLKNVFYLLSGVFLINLYHWWWIPNIPTFTYLFDLELVTRGLSLVNLVSFSYLLWKYQSS